MIKYIFMDLEVCECLDLQVEKQCGAYGYKEWEDASTS